MSQAHSAHDCTNHPHPNEPLPPRPSEHHKAIEVHCDKCGASWRAWMGTAGRRSGKITPRHEGETPED